MTVLLDIEKGLLKNVRYVPSPNFNERPRDTVIDLIVIHNISLPPGEFGGSYIDDFFTNRLDTTAHPYFKEIESLKVSSHCLIRRDGEIVQYVPFHKRAWHAGASSFMERTDCNDFSIGLELEGTDDAPYMPIQYTALANIIGVLKKTYNSITDGRIVGHNTIAPTRKTDPGPSFDWPLLTKLCFNRDFIA